MAQNKTKKTNTKTKKKDIEVGDIVKVTKKERAFPADLLLLQSSTNQGLCNIETANLDGETNLKIKQAIGATYLIEFFKESGEDYPTNPKLDFKLISEVNEYYILTKRTCAIHLMCLLHVCVCVGQAPNEKMDKSELEWCLIF
ncbi:Phospholipid-transporting ATPase [Reticulomyxa filosa]|uniref:Phospholipid-transporting ATPase n=1 Tax=Reticulomyxa filosa TaxID=46433 RepID=X6PBB7_RETFI|nr:Phospholipid-transporting ATPase [Reticulomyxa filosa]|eukprot:ETO34942.1 Phospholipid-transporting ATPase [Reticulomyxa filosa]